MRPLALRGISVLARLFQLRGRRRDPERGLGRRLRRKVPDQCAESTPGQPRCAPSWPEHIPKVMPAVGEVALYRLRVLREERAEALDSPGVTP